jgi:hypothetical protein
MSGVSFQALFSDGWPMRHVFVPITDRLSTMPLVFWKVSAWLTILLEAFLAVGLFLPKVRRTALTIGILFHFAILVLIDDANVIAIYSLTIFIGYLAFLPPRANQEEPSNHLELARTKILLQTCLAAAFIGAIFVIPSRLYFWKDRPPSDLNFYDRSPWAFAMFLMRQTTTSVQIDCKSKDKDWFSYPLEGRMKTISSDSELVALATYLYKSVPRLEKLHIVVTCLINKHWQQIKTFDTKRDQKIFEYKLAIQNKKSRADTI